MAQYNEVIIKISMCDRQPQLSSFHDISMFELLNAMPINSQLIIIKNKLNSKSQSYFIS